MQNYIYWAEDNSEALSHHGILGQKWGVRRFQNEDGTLTAAGKRRRNSIDPELAAERARDRQPLQNTRDRVSKRYGGNLSNRELREATQRLDTVNRYRKGLYETRKHERALSKQDIEANPLAKFATTVGGAVIGTGVTIATAAAVKAVTPYMTTFINNIPSYAKKVADYFRSNPQVATTALSTIRM